MNSLWLLCLLMLLAAEPARAMRGDTVLRKSAQPYPHTNSAALTLRSTVPLLATSLVYRLHNRSVASARAEYFPAFRSRYDDYLQFAPLAAQLGMSIAGVRGRSQSPWEVMTADALSTAIMMSAVTLTKTLTRVERPDGSARNSFPSGHTAMAFASATMLHLEYGARYPWLSLAGYLGAAGVGAGRLLNNRHWIGDVAVGAFVGVAAAELGYFISDRLWGRTGYSAALAERPTTGISLSVPSLFGVGRGLSARHVGVGLRWRYSARGYYAMASALLGQVVRSDTGADSPERRASVQLAWGREWSLGRCLSLDTGAGLCLEGRKLLPALSLSPRLYLSGSTALRLDAQYRLGGEAYRRPSWAFGSALEFSL